MLGNPISAVSSEQARRVSNAERYRHIPTNEILKLLGEGLSHRKAAKRLNMNPSALRARAKKAGYAAPKPAHVSQVELAECRLDPAWEARHGIWKRVVCRECSELKAQLNANGEHSHLRKHKMTGAEYRTKWPGAPFDSFDKAAKLAVYDGRDEDVETAVQRLMKLAANENVTHVELIECRGDRDWEERHDTSVVVCRRCGFKSKVHLYPHLKLHGYLRPSPTDAYRVDYPKAPVEPIDVKTGYRSVYSKQWYADKKAEAERKEARLQELERIAAEAGTPKLRGKAGRPSKTALFSAAAELRSQHRKWPQIAEMLTLPEEKAESGWDRKAAAERLRVGVASLKKNATNR